jgi:hypothetical protein
MRRCIGLDVHREFAQVAIWEDGVVRPCDLQHGLGDVDAEDLAVASGEHGRVAAGTAPKVERPVPARWEDGIQVLPERPPFQLGDPVEDRRDRVERAGRLRHRPALPIDNPSEATARSPGRRLGGRGRGPAGSSLLKGLRPTVNWASTVTSPDS